MGGFFLDDSVLGILLKIKITIVVGFDENKVQ